ncbi:MAG: carbohydrate binding domain-containing protein [Anaerolineaceae bacterium]|nr:carbohydrate binding domain-containing protein [Anaerolineaceae bacterium]
MKKLFPILILFALFLNSCTSPMKTQTALPTVMPTQNAVPETQSSTGQGYPRLGMWWPDIWNQPLEQIARYDWVILGDWQAEAIPQLRALNPKILLLNSTNACELSFNPDDSEENDLVKKIPYQWFLTQVGSTLTQDIDATQTTLPVAALTAQDSSGNEIDLFLPGDALLIENESVYVKRVNSSNLTLEVERGYVRPASAHKAGARIAAHISFWPNSWLLNVSTLSPTAVLDGQFGPERWTDFNARRGQAFLADAKWDGLLIDRSDPNESWLIGNSTARSIDPDQSNQLLTDYSAFDTAWNDGLRSYLHKLRQAVGEEKILFLNWGIADFADTNGDNFEGFPTLTGSPNWHAQVFGPTEAGSYQDWISKAKTPNLTMVETYEDNSGPAPEDTDGYPNRCAQADFVPNYQKMRLGLTTALLMNGYFSYEMNTEGHGSLCLMWFDEYDNAGQGQGYLGQPIGDAVAVAPFSPPDLIQGLTWESWADQGYALSVSPSSDLTPAGSASVEAKVSQSAGTDWQASYSVAPVEIQNGQEYTLTFSAQANMPTVITAWIQQDHDPWQTYLWFGEFDLTDEWQTFTLPLAAEGNDSAAQLHFGLGKQVANIWLGDVSLKQGNADVYRRDFEHGIVLVNATRQAVTLQLGGEFRKINGQQDPAVNDGSIVTEVTLPAQDGIILLRVPVQ